MGGVAKRQDSLPGLLPDNEAKALVEAVAPFWPDDGSPVELRRELTQNERARLERRHRDLYAQLRPIKDASEEKKRAAEALSAMFLGFPSMRNADAPGTIAAFIMALDSYPLFAIIQATKTFRRLKSYDDLNYPPNSNHLAEASQQAMAPLEEERIRIAKVLKAKVPDPEPTPEQRARVLEKYAALKKLRAVEDAADEARRDQLLQEQASRARALLDAKILAEYARLKMEPVYLDEAKTQLVSPSLLTTLRDQGYDPKNRHKNKSAEK